MVISVDKEGEGKIGTRRSFRVKIEELNGTRYMSSINDDGFIISRYELSEASEDALEKALKKIIQSTTLFNGVMGGKTIFVDPDIYKFLVTECEKLTLKT